MAMGHERTKEELYNQAKRMGIKGRSKMNKGHSRLLSAGAATDSHT